MDILSLINLKVLSKTGGGFEINLDKRKLKTPSGTLFKVSTY